MLDLKPIQATRAKLLDRTEEEKGKAGGAGDRERAALYHLNLASFAGEVHVGQLLAEVERLRAIEAAARAVAGFVLIRNDGIVIDGGNDYEERRAAVAALHAALATE